MYFLFARHHLLPGDYYRLPAGDKVVLRAFFEQYMDDLKDLPQPMNPAVDKAAIRMRGRNNGD